MLSLQSSEMERHREYRDFGIAEGSIPLNNRAYSEEETPAGRHTQPRFRPAEQASHLGSREMGGRLLTYCSGYRIVGRRNV